MPHSKLYPGPDLVSKPVPFSSTEDIALRAVTACRVSEMSNADLGPWPRHVFTPRGFDPRDRVAPCLGHGLNTMQTLKSFTRCTNVDPQVFTGHEIYCAVSHLDPG
jgi:hypothetical protein